MNSQMENTADSEELPGDSTVQRAVQGSRLGRLGQWLAGAVRDSYLYQWVTAEPDPDVIVIDLRETWTIGPAIRLLDAGIDRLAPAVRESRIAGAVQMGVTITRQQPAVVAGLGLLIMGALVGVTSVATGTLGTSRFTLTAVTLVAGIFATRERRSWTELRETRPVGLFLAALEPPEPPEEHTSRDGPSDESDDDK
jgi:hypothetical protein